MTQKCYTGQIMRTDLVMGVDLPPVDSGDGEQYPQLYYGSRKRSTGLLELNGRTKMHRDNSNEARTVLFDEPFRIPQYTNVFGVREASLTLMERLGMPVNWSDWPVVATISYSDIPADRVVHPIPADEGERWVLIREYDDNHLKEGVTHRNARDLYQKLQSPLLMLIKDVIMSEYSSEDQLRLVGEKPYLEWLPHHVRLFEPEVQNMRAALRERLWDEHEVWFDWFSKPILSQSHHLDPFLSRDDVQLKLASSQLTT
jgi:hypothetical protein